MSIRRDLVIKVSNGTATLDMPLQIYEKDHGIELRFKLMDYKYKYDKDPENILNSNKEDILEAYTTIVNPRGYELAQINGEVVDDTIKFMIEDSYTDELEELGIYQLQIHVKCTHSEFSIPPVRFEVLERLKGEKVVTDGDDEVDHSDIIDGSTKFVDDETGKLIIQWQKGDTISSVRLNAMVEVINNAVDEEAQRQLNEVEREQQELEREQQELERENRLQAALDSVDTRVDESMNEYETRFNALTASQQQDMEVIDARDGETSLKARLDRDVRNPLQVYEDVEGSYIICDSSEGYAQNVEILGNTIQDADNLADIRSVGDNVGGQELYKIDVVSCGKNIIDLGNYETHVKYPGSGVSELLTYVKIKKNTDYVITGNYRKSINVNMNGGIAIVCTREVPINKLGWFVSHDGYKGVFNTEIYDVNISAKFNSEDYNYVAIYVGVATSAEYNHTATLKNLQIEEGTVATQYEPYQEHKLTILSPVQLEKVGDAADRIVCKDGVWGVEKNVKTVIYDGSEHWELSSADHSKKDILRFYTATDCVATKYETVGPIMSDRFATDSYNGMYINNAEGISTTIDNDIGISILKSKLSTQDVAGLKKWLEANNTIVKYQPITPQFIPLPHDQQVKLRTFAGKTNISFLTEIEGTIKAQVPKSIGATVNTHTEQINNLNKELGKVKKLEESTVSTVTTESDFTTVEETSNGYFEDVKLEGKTLVNLMYEGTNIGGNGNTHYVSASEEIMNDFASKIKTSTKYTIILYNAPAEVYKVYFCGLSTTLKVKPNVFILNNSETEVNNENFHFYTSNGEIPSDVLSDIKVVILEGDHTQNPPGYFEGLMSVGEDVDEINIKSVNRNGNLFDKSQYIPAGFSSPKIIFDSSYRTYYIKCEPNTSYYVRSKGAGNRFSVLSNSFIQYDSSFTVNKSYSSNGSISEYNDEYAIFTTGPNDRYLFLYVTNNGVFIDQPIIHIEKSSVVKEYKEPQLDEKPLLYYNSTTQTWEKPILRQWDSIEKHSDGKYYYHKRSGEIVFNGSESWVPSTLGRPNYYRMYFVNRNYAYKEYSHTINDTLPNDTVNIQDRDVEGVYITNTFDIQINISKLSSADLVGATQWLQANPTTVVYQLTQEEVYECINIDLLTYENETTFIVNTGVISPKTTLKVICNITNVVRELQQKVSNLENYIQHVMIDALNNALNE